MKLFESAFLIHLQDTDVINLEMLYPPEHSFTEELKSISSAVAPSLELPSSPMIFSFNLNYCLCHVLYFIYENMPYEIIIFSKTPFAFLFHSFLNEVFNEFKNAETTPRMRFQYVLSYLSSWDNEVKPEITLSFPSGNTKWELNQTLSSYLHYSPLSFFSKDQCKTLFNSFIIGDPVLIIAPTGRVSSLACFAAMSLLSPLQFVEPNAIWLRETDPRFVELVNGNSDLLLVGSPCETLESLGYFKTIIRISKPESLSLDCTMIFGDQMKSIMEICATEMDDLLLENPWSDIIDADFNEHRVANFIALAENESITPEMILRFSKTKTFKLWRRRVFNRDKWREAILSSIPQEIVPKLPHDALKKVLKMVDLQLDRYSKDMHVVATLKNYQILIEAETQFDYFYQSLSTKPLFVK